MVFRKQIPLAQALLMAAATSCLSLAAAADQGLAENARLPGSSPFKEPAEAIWETWAGDLDGMVERRVVRALVPYGGYQFYYEGGAPRGAAWEMLKRLEDYLNETLGRRNVRVYVAAIPVSRDQMLPALLAGNADLIAADLTETRGRRQLVDFTRPLLKDINEIVVSGPGVSTLDTLDDLAGREILVRPSSSYYEHLLSVALDFRERGLEPPKIVPAAELLEAHDILELVNSGIADITVVDDYKAAFWNKVFPNISLHEDLVVHSGGQVSWAHRKDSPEFAAMIKGFMRKYGRGTLVGNDTFSRYLSRVDRVRCAGADNTTGKTSELEAAFRASGEEFDFDWLMLAAQAYQESNLRHNRRSPAGAVGIMQIKPSTAADPNVGIPDISSIENNIRAGAKYMRFVGDRYFANDDMPELSRWLFSLAAYNAGPARIARLRRETESEGRNPNLWFDHVEIVAARKIGRETVTYVSNIYKYYVGYQLAYARNKELEREFGDILNDCSRRNAP